MRQQCVEIQMSIEIGHPNMLNITLSLKTFILFLILHYENPITRKYSTKLYEKGRKYSTNRIKNHSKT